MRKEQPKPGQVGNYWLSKKPGRDSQSDAWCRTWYDAKIRQTRRVSLGTSNLQEASSELTKWVILNERPQSGRPEDVLIETVLLTWWDEHGRKTASAKSQQYNLARWQEFWAGKTVADITPHTQKQFRDFLGDIKTSSIDRILSTGRAALIRAVKWQELQAAPHIFGVETPEERESREPMGKPITTDEMASLFDAVHTPHLLTFLIIAATTLARPGAILELRTSQFDPATGTLRLNPDGRIQNKKRRPIVPVAQTLRPWLEMPVPTPGYYVSTNGHPLKGIKSPFRVLRLAAGLSDDVNTYSFRHGMAQALQDRKVPRDQISYIMGHRRKGDSPTTEVYARFKPDHCADAVAAIESVLDEVQQKVRSINLRDPADAIVQLAKRRTSGSKLSKGEQDQLRKMIATGMPVSTIAKHFKVTTTSVYKHRDKMRRNQCKAT